MGIADFTCCMYQIENCIFSVAREKFITFDDAVKILKSELKYPDERAMHFVKKFDRNKDGKLSESEFNNFRAKINHT